MKLPKGLLKKHHGNMKAAWAEARRGRRGHNPRRRGRTSHRRHGRRRGRNPTGYPLSGRRYRPVFRRGGSSYTHRRSRRSPLGATAVSRSWAGARRHRRASHRRSARKVSHRRGRRGRKGRRNPSFGFGGSRSRMSMGGLRNAIPLLRRSDFRLIWSHKVGSLVVGGAGYFVGGIMGQAGGTVLILVTAFGGGLAIRYFVKGEKYAFAAPAWALGGVLAAVSHVVTTKSLTGAASLGDSLDNLKALAASVKVAGVPALSASSMMGLSGTPTLKLALKGGGLDSLLAGLGEKKYPANLAGVGATSSNDGWSYSG